jgi:hypothetical protein
MCRLVRVRFKLLKWVLHFGVRKGLPSDVRKGSALPLAGLIGLGYALALTVGQSHHHRTSEGKPLYIRQLHTRRLQP